MLCSYNGSMLGSQPCHAGSTPAQSTIFLGAKETFQGGEDALLSMQENLGTKTCDIIPEVVERYTR